MISPAISALAPPLEFKDSCWTGRFQAMACPCEVIIDTDDKDVAAAQVEIARREAERIEAAFSRYRSGNIVDRINHAEGQALRVDDETAGLLDYAAECYSLSDGLFDITTGVLRNVWRFDGAERRIDEDLLAAARARLGWARVEWRRPFLRMPSGFEIDFGGIGKEYAADKILALLTQQPGPSALVNLGGDIAAAGTRIWRVGIESVTQSGEMRHTVSLRSGGIATSGTTRRFMKAGGKTYSHILHPQTGWPVFDAPESVTVAARTCTEAGMWSTLAVLQGAGAEAFLQKQSLPFWCDRISRR